MNRLYIVIVILTLILTGYFVYNKLAFLNVVVSFDELEPFEKQLPVYYKGFKVGKSVKVYPDKHYKNTFVKLKLYPADVELPNNISARIQKSKRTDYFNLIAPDEASVILLKDGDTIKGELNATIEGINMEVNKLSVYLVIPKAIRDLALPFVDKYFLAILQVATNV